LMALKYADRMFSYMSVFPPRAVRHLQRPNAEPLGRQRREGGLGDGLFIRGGARAKNAERGELRLDDFFGTVRDGATHRPSHEPVVRIKDHGRGEGAVHKAPRA
jgi:hypothetical protein